jgi:hypothetical protein
MKRRIARKMQARLGKAMALGQPRDLEMQRKPTWLVEVSTGSGWRAAGR